jgi:hypothetical protein
MSNDNQGQQERAPMPCTCPPDSRPKECQERYALSVCCAADLYERLHSMSKSLESSGRLDEHENPDAYATVLDAMRFMRLYGGA